MDLLTKAELLADSGDIRFIDFHFLRLLKNLDPAVCDDILLAALLASFNSSKGDVCIDLLALSSQQLFPNNLDSINITTPQIEQWLSVLKKSPLISTNDSVAPLVLVNEQYLFMQRYWDYEVSLAENINQFSKHNSDVDIDLLKNGVQKYFSNNPTNSDSDPDWQMVAAISAVLNKFSVITGGPGTGKTTTITKVLALIAQQGEGRYKNIVLAAPTGKAANRLSESIQDAKKNLGLSNDIADQIPDQVTTLHRLLGASSARASFLYNENNKLSLDVLVVDEASMVDLAMMSKLMRALPEHAQIILLGDMNQLASVESGSVLADICAVGIESGYSSQRSELLSNQFGVQLEKFGSKAVHPLGDCIVELKKSYRFDDKSGIGSLARATNSSSCDDFYGAFNSAQFTDIEFHSVDTLSINKYIENLDIEPYKNYLESDCIELALERLPSFQILSPMRDGVFGVRNINYLVQSKLQRSGLIHIRGKHFHGQPIMVTENNYKAGLYNGDIGIIWSDNGELKGFFPTANGTKRFLLAKLPAYETVFAMTIHKSQGSEFENVLIITPDKYSEYLSKELLYTAITRAKKNVKIWGVKEVINNTIRATVSRNSLLKDQLFNS